MRVAVINDTRSIEQHFGCSLVMNNLYKLLSSQGIQVVWSWPVNKDWREYRHEILEKEKVDLFLVNGEGTIHHSSPSRKMPLSLASFAKFALDELNTSSVLINSTLYMNTPDVYRMLSWYKEVFVRDCRSLDELRMYDLQAKVVPDLSMAYANKFLRNNSRREGVGVTDSYFKGVSDRLRKLSVDESYQYMPMIADRKHSGVRDLFVGSARNKLNDDDFVEWISSKKMIITGRYHTATICLLTRTPFVAVESNTPKISALLQDVFGANERIIYDPSFVHPKGEIMTRFSAYSEKETALIDLYLKKAASLQQEMISSLFDACNT